MQDSYIELVKLLLPEILVDNFELTSFEKNKKEEILHKQKTASDSGLFLILNQWVLELMLSKTWKVK